MPTQIQLRRGTAAQWTSANPTLASGELGVETDTGKIKVGSGSTAWTSLLYSGGTPAGSTGQLQFNTSNQFAASSNLFWDNTNNRLGVNTSSPAYQLDINNASSYTTIGLRQAGTLRGYVEGGDSAVKLGTNGSVPILFEVNGSERMRITSSGYTLFNNSISIGSTSDTGTTAPPSPGNNTSLVIYRRSNSAAVTVKGIEVYLPDSGYTPSSTSYAFYGTSFNYGTRYGVYYKDLRTAYGPSYGLWGETDAHGVAVTGKTNIYDPNLGANFIGVQGTVTNSAGNTGANSYSYCLYADNQSTRGNSNYGCYATTVASTNNNNVYGYGYAHTGTTRFYVYNNGGIYNYSANNVNLSDRREKTNFAAAKDYLDVICAIPVQTFNYIGQDLERDPGLTLGVVAQDVLAVAPELVNESNWAAPEDEEEKIRLSIYQTDLQYALMKCIQELKAIVDAQAARIAVLEGN